VINTIYLHFNSQPLAKLGVCEDAENKESDDWGGSCLKGALLCNVKDDSRCSDSFSPGSLELDWTYSKVSGNNLLVQYKLRIPK